MAEFDTKKFDVLTHQQKIEWMAVWASKNGMALKLEGECGFGRPCVGVSIDGHYPDYHWYDHDTYDQLDANGDVWCPEDAYHKHECVAVLGRGQAAEEQLFLWLNWFDENGFVLETGEVPLAEDQHMRHIQLIMGGHRYARMVRKNLTVVGARNGR